MTSFHEAIREFGALTSRRRTSPLESPDESRFQALLAFFDHASGDDLPPARPLPVAVEQESAPAEEPAVAASAVVEPPAIEPVIAVAPEPAALASPAPAEEPDELEVNVVEDEAPTVEAAAIDIDVDEPASDEPVGESWLEPPTELAPPPDLIGTIEIAAEEPEVETIEVAPVEVASSEPPAAESIEPLPTPAAPSPAEAAPAQAALVAEDDDTDVIEDGAALLTALPEEDEAATIESALASLTPVADAEATPDEDATLRLDAADVAKLLAKKDDAPAPARVEATSRVVEPIPGLPPMPELSESEATVIRPALLLTPSPHESPVAAPEAEPVVAPEPEWSASAAWASEPAADPSVPAPDPAWEAPAQESWSGAAAWGDASTGWGAAATPAPAAVATAAPAVDAWSAPAVDAWSAAAAPSVPAPVETGWAAPAAADWSAPAASSWEAPAAAEWHAPEAAIEASDEPPSWMTPIAETLNGPPPADDVLIADDTGAPPELASASEFLAEAAAANGWAPAQVESWQAPSAPAPAPTVAPELAEWAAPAWQPPRAALVLTGEHRVVVHTLEGGVKRGIAADLDLAGDEVGLAQGQGQPPLDFVPFSRAKAVFFMLKPGEKPQPASGRRVKVTFTDGRQMEGVLGEEIAQGFFLLPTEPRTSTARVYVLSHAVRQVV